MHNSAFSPPQAARLKINEEFQKNKNETSEENIKQVQFIFLTPLYYLVKSNKLKSIMTFLCGLCNVSINNIALLH